MDDQPTSVIFDLDGVVVDSQAAHSAAYGALFAEEGVRFGSADYVRVALGRPREAVLRRVLGPLEPAREARLMARKEVLMREHLDREGLAAVPGTIELDDALAAAGIPRAIATSSRTPGLLLAAAGLAERFAVIVHRGEVARGKPHPDLFLEAARRLGVAPGTAVVVEDAPVGIEAARRAGCRVVGLTTGEPAEALAAADLVVARLDPGWVEHGRLQIPW